MTEADVPTYQYVCRACGHQLEAVQSFTDEPLTDCPTCEDGRLRKVFSSVGVVFKGPGFYRTDSREKPKVSAEGAKSSDGGKAADSSSSESSSSSSSSSGSSTNGGSSSGSSGGSKTPSASTTGS
jgi:putative FmdB family regulatory protein